MRSLSAALASGFFFSFLLCSGGRPPEAARGFPRAEAEKLIRALNLVPRDAAPLPPGGERADADRRTVERRIHLPVSPAAGNAGGASVRDLGHHAGYYKLEHAYDARMFYFFFESRRACRWQDPVVIWLTGGPGCGSELALFFENGPFKIADNMSLLWNDYGWDKISNLIYVDQPTGTGFSYTHDERDLRHDEEGVSNDLYDFLQAFFIEHQDYAANDLYITGESYAGHYIPAFASRIHQRNKAGKGIHINLKGFAIGNGLTDPAIQYQAYPDYALQAGIIRETDYIRIKKDLPLCEAMIKLCGQSGSDSCLASYLICNTIFHTIVGLAQGINYYDIRRKCEGDLCYDFSIMEKLLNDKSVRDTLGVGDLDFVSCSIDVYQAMLTDWMRNLEVGIPGLLEDGINLLVYAGEYDLICNWLGNSRWVEAMEWSGRQRFASSPSVKFLVDGAEAGLMKTHGPLSFLKVHNAGHMVPMDQPKAALEILERWIEGTLADSPSEVVLTELPPASGPPGDRHVMHAVA